MKKTLALLSLPVLLTACSAYDSENYVKPADLQHHHWVLSEIDGNALPTDDVTKIPDLEIGENMQSNGLAGCNNFHGQAQINPETGEFRIDKMGMTMKMCRGAEMQYERAVSSTLSAWSTINLSKDSLELKGEEHTLTYTLRDWVN